MIQSSRSAGPLAATGAARTLAWLAPTVLFLTAFALRLAYVRQVRGNPLYDSVYALMDSLYYDAWARATAAGSLIGNTPFILGPLYHYVMALLYAVFGADPEVVQTFQCALGALSCVLLYRIGRRAFSGPVGLLAGGVLALYGLDVYYAALLLPTVLVVFLNLLFLLVMLPPDGVYSVRRCLAGGAVIGLAALAKSNALLLLPAALAVVWWTQRHVPLRRYLVRAAALIGAAAAVVAPAPAHNYAASGEFVPISTNGGVNLWKGNGPFANGTHVFLPRSDKATSLRKYVSGEVDPRQPIRESQRFRQRTVHYVARHPGPTTRLLLKKVRLFFNQVELGIRDQFYFAKLSSPLLRLPLFSFAFVAPLGLLGMTTAWRQRSRRAMLYALFAVQLVSFVAVFVLARYRLVAAVCLILFASHQVFAWAEALRDRRWRALAASLVGLAFAATLVDAPLSEFPEDRGFALQYRRLGNLLLERGDHAGAIDAYRRALDSDWQDKDPRMEKLDVRLWIALAQARMGRHAEAMRTATALEAELEPMEDIPETLASGLSQLLEQLAFEKSATGER